MASFAMLLHSKNARRGTARVGWTGSVPQILLHQLLEQLVPVQLADQGPGVVVVGDIGGILAEDIAHDLVDGVVPLFLQGIVNGCEDGFDFVAPVEIDAEPARIIHVVQWAHPPELNHLYSIVTGRKCKGEK